MSDTPDTTNIDSSNFSFSIDESQLENLKKTGGSLLSKLGTGTSVGGTLGSIVPGVGTAVGSIVGTIVAGINSITGKKPRLTFDERNLIAQKLGDAYVLQLKRYFTTAQIRVIGEYLKTCLLFDMQDYPYLDEQDTRNRLMSDAKNVFSKPPASDTKYLTDYIFYIVHVYLWEADSGDVESRIKNGVVLLVNQRVEAVYITLPAGYVAPYVESAANPQVPGVSNDNQTNSNSVPSWVWYVSGGFVLLLVIYFTFFRS
jgi:hypothetical protein